MSSEEHKVHEWNRGKVEVGFNCRTLSNHTRMRITLLRKNVRGCGGDPCPGSKPMISGYSPILPVSFGASCRTRTFSLSVLLQSASVPPQELASIRTEFLRQYSSRKGFQPFVQRTFTVCPVDFQKNDFEFWCPSLVRRAFEPARFADSKAIRRVV